MAYFMIFVGISGVGFEYARRLGNRKHWYEEFIDFVGFLAQEIQYGHFEFKECLSHTLAHSREFFNGFTDFVLEGLSACDGRGMDEIWQDAVAMNKNALMELGCGDEEADFLLRIGTCLDGLSSEQLTDRLIGLKAEALEKRNIISEDLCNRQKAVRLLGICLGAFSIVVLM